MNSPIRFAVAGLSHNHIFSISSHLISAGAELVSFYGNEPEHLQDFGKHYPQASHVTTLDEILEAQSIDLVVSAAIPNERAPLGIQVMQHGKDFLCAKPGVTSLAQLAELRHVQQETQRMYAIYFGERFGNPATVKAGELVQAGAIGQVIQTTGFGPHKLGHVVRPEWMFRRERQGGILADLASHQIDQFLFFTGSRSAQIVAAHRGNMRHPQYPDFDDFGDITLRSDHSSGYIRVDWLTPDGLDTWGDVRLFILGTQGYIELRKNCDLAGRSGANHLFLVDQQGTHYIDCANTPLPYAAQLLDDLRHRTEKATPQDHYFLTSELALQAQVQAHSISP